MMVLVHAANVLTLISYLVKDILWLRLLAVLAGVLSLAFLFSRAEPALVPIGWNLVFFVINVAQIYLLVLERRPVSLREHEQRLHQLVFRTLRPREFMKLLALGKWEERKADEVLVASGKTLDRVMVILDGTAAVTKDGKRIVELGAGRFIGEMCFITGQAPATDVACTAPTRLVTWPSASLKRFFAENPETRAAMQLIIGADLVAKLKA